MIGLSETEIEKALVDSTFNENQISAITKLVTMNNEKIRREINSYLKNLTSSVNRQKEL